MELDYNPDRTGKQPIHAPDMLMAVLAEELCNNLQRLEDSVFSPDKRNHGRWSARVCARMRNRSEKGLNALASRRTIDQA